MLEELKNEKKRIQSLSAKISDRLLKNDVKSSELEYIEDAIERNINELKHMKDLINAGKRLNKITPKPIKLDMVGLRNKIVTWTDSSCGTTAIYKEFVKEFKRLFKVELKKINAENIVFNVGHYEISGNFMLGEQAYWFCSADIRTNNTNIWIRTCKDYKDYQGGTNHMIRLNDDMFVDFFGDTICTNS